MTIASTTSKLLYNGDGATTDFAISFVFWQSSDIRVILRDANGVETVWTEGSHYTITGGGGSTGTLTVMTAPTDHTPASGEKLLIKSDIAEVQQAALPLGGAFPSTTVEQMVDIVTRLVQQHSEQIARTLVAAETDDDPGALPTSAARAGRYLAFDASGSAIASPGPAGEVAVSAFGASLVDDMSAPAARATLGLGGAAVKNTGTVNDTIPLLGANGALPASIGAFPRAVAGKTGAYSVVAADQGTLFVGDTAGGPFTITLPVLAGVADGFTVACKCDGANALTVAADGAETIDGAASLALDGDGYLVVTRAGGEWKILAQTAPAAPVRVLDRNMAVNDIVNTAAETSLYSYTVPANTLGTNKALRVTIAGEYFNNSGGSRTLTLRVKYGATTLFDDTTFAMPAATVLRGFQLQLTLSARNATSAQALTGLLIIGGAGGTTTGVGDLNAAASLVEQISGVSAEDSTGALTLDVTAQWGFANANLSIKATQRMIETLP